MNSHKRVYGSAILALLAVLASVATWAVVGGRRVEAQDPVVGAPEDPHVDWQMFCRITDVVGPREGVGGGSLAVALDLWRGERISSHPSKDLAVIVAEVYPPGDPDLERAPIATFVHDEVLPIIPGQRNEPVVLIKFGPLPAIPEPYTVVLRLESVVPVVDTVEGVPTVGPIRWDMETFKFHVQ